MDKNAMIEVVYGKSFCPKPLKLKIFKYICSYIKSLRIRKMYKKYGFNSAITEVEKIKSDILFFEDTLDAVYNARRIVILSNYLSKLFFLSGNCLENSLALSAILSYLGYKHSLLIGKKRNYMGGNYIFHAFLEINGVCINGIIGTKEMLSIVYNKCLG